MPLKRAVRKPREIFLSHSSRNRKFAAKVAAFLRRQGISVWFSPTHIVGARQWHDEIGRALSRCDWFVIISPDAVRSKWVKRELLYVLNDARYEDRIVPLLYRRADASRLSWILPSLQSVDFTKDYDAGCHALLRVWGSPRVRKV